MSREAWVQIRHSKNFNMRIYRRGLTVLILSLIMCLIFGTWVFYLYLHQPERTYYATSGIVDPVQLQALPEPNNLGVPLLEPDPPNDDIPRIIPE